MSSVGNSCLDFGLVDWRVAVFVFLEDFLWEGRMPNGFCCWVLFVCLVGK
jgi:hypothetical protein